MVRSFDRTFLDDRAVLCSRPWVGLGKGHGKLAHHRPGEAGTGLEHALGVDQVGVAQFARVDAPDQGAERLGIDGGPQNPGPVALAAHDRDDEVREFAEAHEHVRDVLALEHGLVEPGLVLVVHALEGEGADVGHVLAVLVDDAQVDVGLGVGLDDVEDGVESGGVGELLVGVGVGQAFELGHPFVEKDVQGLLAVVHRPFQVACELLVVGL
jgi:hypothetical protein